jgi:S1-C subfamily serine protease
MLPMVAVLVLHFGHSTAASTPLWDDHQVPVAPGQAQVPNWVELARALKPAVVNISTKRTEQGLPALQSPPGQPDPFEPFLQQFFDNQPRTARGLGSGFIIIRSATS